MTWGFWVTTTGGLGEDVGGLRIGMIGLGGKGILEDGVVVGEILLDVTGG